MPYCVWCRRFIERARERWRCDACGTFYCDDCAVNQLRKSCPLCAKKGEEGPLRRYPPPVMP